MNKTKEVQGSKQIFENEESAGDAYFKEGVKCFDCECEIKIEKEEIVNGSLLSYTENADNFFVFKCDDCFSKNKVLADYKECEIYTRIVGYLRPVKQYNPGKQQEYKERTEYQVE